MAKLKGWTEPREEFSIAPGIWILQKPTSATSHTKGHKGCLLRSLRDTIHSRQHATGVGGLDGCSLRGLVPAWFILEPGRLRGLLPPVFWQGTAAGRRRWLDHFRAANSAPYRQSRFGSRNPGP